MPVLRPLRALAAAAAALAVGLAGWAAPTPASAASPLDGFDPGNLISDAAFYRPGAMTRAEVTAFVTQIGAACVPNADKTPCLKDYTVPTPALTATAYCAALAANPANTGAGIVADVATACGINPQVLLVLIQRESSLLTRSGSQLTRQMYNQATGAGCPDFTGCAPDWASYFAQVYGAAERFQKYRQHPERYNHRAGTRGQIAYHPETTCGKASVYLQNQATAGLYNYTPYVPNQAAIAAVSGTGDACSTYGNRNFHRILRAWFPATASGSTAPPIAPSPPATVTPALTETLARASQLTAARTGNALAPMTCTAAGVCSKRYANLTIWWTAARRTTLGVAGVTAPPAPYTDAASSGFRNEVEWLTARRIATGWPDGTFRPAQPIARDAMAAFLHRAAGAPAFTPTRQTFRDVTPDNPFYREIEWAASVGITTGYPDGTYRPLEPVRRDAMAAFLHRASGSPALTPPARATFTDVPAGLPFRAEIEWLVASGVTTGYPDGTYRPWDPVSREAMAAFLYRRAGG